MKSHELIVRRRVKLSIFVAGSLLLRLAQGMQGFASLGKMIKNMSGDPWMGRVAGLLMSLGEWGRQFFLRPWRSSLEMEAAVFLTVVLREPKR